MEPKRCAGCGIVGLHTGVVCPACRKPSLRPLTRAEQRAWAQVSPDGVAMAGRAVAVRCAL